MNTFKRKALSTVVLGALGAAAGAAHAVYQDPNGLGQALIYPYYSVQTANGSAFNTYISVVNSTSQGKVLKVRAREGKTSAEVLDFNLYLSPNDVWTAAIIPIDASATAGARLITGDVSCTNPAIPSGGVDFRNYQYVGDGLGNGLDRTREGYMEIIEMATLTGSALAAATHNTAGTPTCAGLVGPSVGAAGQQVQASNRSVPTGGINGTGTLINVNNGVEMGYNAVALANVSAGDIYAEIGTEQGNFNNADAISVVVANNRVYRSTFATSSGVTGGVRAVSSTLDRSSIINEYVLDTATRSNTDWVMTFPTKWYFYVGAAGTPETPFTGVLGASGACEPIAVTYFNREERGAAASGVDFSPLPPGTPGSSLCWESTVMSIRNGSAHNPTGTTSGVLGSNNTVPINVTSTFQNGWMNVQFTGAGATLAGLGAATTATTNVLTGAASAVAATYFGLPVVGFMVRTFNNGTVPSGGATVLSNYGSAFDHKYRETITPTP
jgi:hypothetical protein